MPFQIEEIAPDVFEDLAPLVAALPGGEPLLPADLEEPLGGAPLTNGAVTVVPWVYETTSTISFRGDDQQDPRRVFVEGVTIVIGEGDDASFRRYVDWAGVWAQLGRSQGRGELGGEPPILDAFGRPVER